MTSSKKQKKEFVFGSFVYHYDLVMEDRKSLCLTVEPDLRISLKSPHDAGLERIENFLRKKWFWLEKQLSFFRKYQRKIYKKEYVSGESFLYLGRQYKLVIEKSSVDKVVLKRGILSVQTTRKVSDALYTKKLIDGWYRSKISIVFKERFTTVLQQFDYKKMPELAIRSMNKRWGSFLENGVVVLNPKLIHTPKNCIDYVIAHELCHVKYKKHNKLFYAFLGKKYPNWEKVKEKLEIIGVQTS